ncbi:Glyoxalase/bleomycin resistance protein/dioxygenase [Methanobacterium lacus]|jgi:lactoylglutathione lyase|uniref:Glyoxalase/bleomycin resistance protein/dioxygenase n=1 Tax=Methanobacterium lacus (strain AL-21) TaxID=877455 RepID=F0TA35_METLA|nr:VOC family protein [Methanobacterium lacus]ADZ09985.1 Glyoxalase/bleomycin resistance protein/dioxygenase [Methanobacterium lacus]
MKVKYATIAVSDMEESVKFYTEVMGFNVDHTLNPYPGFNITFLANEGDAMVELIENKNEPQTPGIFLIGMEVEDMDKTAAELIDKGAEFTRGPLEVGDGAKLAFLKDPNGVEIELIQH